MALDVLAIGAHPDDVELACGGTLALLARAGRRVGLLHLTGGEAGSRGTAGERRREAEDAAAILGAVELAFLDCGDGGLRTGAAEEEALIAELRRLRPELVFAPAPADRHPDHGRAHRLVADACFYAGLRRRGSGEPHRPAALFAYMQHDPFPPAFIVDVSAVWEVKQRALDAYESQLHRGLAGGGGSGGETASGGPSGAAGGTAGAGVGDSDGAAAGEAAASTKLAAGASPRSTSDPGSGDPVPDTAAESTPAAGSRAGGPPAGAPAPVATKVSSREFRLAVAGRAQHFGLMVGAAYGEPFWSPLPLAVRDPLLLLPGGPR